MPDDHKTGFQKLSMTAVVMDAWPGTGMGHSFLGTAIWLRVSKAFGFHVRFAYCVPEDGLTPITRPFVHRQRLPMCSTTVFDLHDYVRRADEEPLKATAADFKAIDKVLSKPTSIILDELFRLYRNESISTRTIGIYYARVKMVRDLARNPSNLHHEMRQLYYPWPLPPIRCEVGLHIRTMRLDDPKCSVFNKCGARRARCSMPIMTEAQGKCDAKYRFVTADSDEVYSNLTKWVNMGDRAVRTWNTRALVPKGEYNKTVQAFMLLSSCSRSIISPVPSQFSLTASVRAGVPLRHCC